MASQLTTTRDTILIIRSDEDEDLTAVTNMVRRATSSIAPKVVQDALTCGTLRPFFDDGDVQRHGKGFLNRVIDNIAKVAKSPESSTDANTISAEARTNTAHAVALSSSSGIAQRRAHPSVEMIHERLQLTLASSQHQAPSQPMPPFGELRNVGHPVCAFCFVPHHCNQPCIDNGYYARVTARPRAASSAGYRTRWATAHQMLNLLQEKSDFSNTTGPMVGDMQSWGFEIVQKPCYWEQEVFRRPRGKSLLNARNASHQFKVSYNTVMNQEQSLPGKSSGKRNDAERDRISQTFDDHKSNGDAERFEKMSFKENKMASKARRNQLHPRHRSPFGEDSPTPQDPPKLQKSPGNNSQQSAGSTATNPPKRKPKNSKAPTQDLQKCDTQPLPASIQESLAMILSTSPNLMPAAELPILEEIKVLDRSQFAQQKSKDISGSGGSSASNKAPIKTPKATTFIPAVPDISLLKAKKPVASKDLIATTAFPPLDPAIKWTTEAPLSNKISPIENENSGALAQRSRRCSAVQILRQHTERRLSQPISPRSSSQPDTTRAVSPPRELPSLPA